MSVIKVNNITNRDGTSGPVIAGIATVSTTSHLVVPTGRTGQRYVDGGENIVRNGLILHLDAKYSYPSTVGIGTTTSGAAATPGSSIDGEPYTWYDISGYENNGELVNSVGFGTTNGGVLLFDGVNDSVSITTLDLRQDFTYECWVKHNQVLNFSFLGQGVLSDNSGIHIYFRNSTPDLRFGMYGNDTDALSLSTSTNTWYQYVFSYTHSAPFTKRIYRNGVELATTGDPVIQSKYVGTGTVRIGATYSSGVQYANGSFSNVKLYNRVLSATEVLQNYNALKSRFGL